MNDKETGLENFIERHRADFDAFEPRPDLWDDLEQKLVASMAEAAAAAPTEIVAAESVRLVKLYPAATAAGSAAQRDPHPTPSRVSWWPHSGTAAAVALLVLAGAGAMWSNEHRGAGWASTSTSPLVLTAPLSASPAARVGLYFDASPVANAAEAPAQQLATAVRRMETYYATQIREQRQELRQLEAAGVSAPPADWERELVSLDSTYGQLKVELYRHPEPDVVLEAMNRNLQIRLDILHQQTRSREQVQQYQAQPLLIADRRPMP